MILINIYDIKLFFLITGPSSDFENPQYSVETLISLNIHIAACITNTLMLISKLKKLSIRRYSRSKYPHCVSELSTPFQPFEAVPCWWPRAHSSRATLRDENIYRHHHVALVRHGPRYHMLAWLVSGTLDCACLQTWIGLRQSQGTAIMRLQYVYAK